MVASKLTNYWSKVDKFGCKVSDWAKETSTSGRAKCKFCLNCEIDFKSGAFKLISHSETNKHRNNLPKASATTSQQVTIEKAFNIDKTKQIKDKREENEIFLIRWASRHNIPFQSLLCLADGLGTRTTDESLQNLSVGRTKCSYVAVHGIGEYYLQNIIEKIRESDGFSIGVDESAMNKREEFEIVVKFSHPVLGVQTQHFKTIELHQGDAEYIVSTLMEAFVVEGIDISQKLVSVATDGAAVMIGINTGVHQRLKEKVPDLQFLTNCMDHNISNSMEKGTKEFCPDLELAMVNLYEDLSGTKGRSLKKRDAFLKTAENLGLDPQEIPKMSSTRYRAIGNCTRSAEHNLPILKEYYSNLNKPTPRQELLKKYFVDQAPLTQLKLLFIKFAIHEMEEAINFFEESTDNFHLIYSKMEQLIQNQFSKFIKDSALRKTDEEGNVIKHSGKTLLDFDFDKKEAYRSFKTLKIGEECSAFMRKLNLEPDDVQVKTFMESGQKFHITVAKSFVKYFEPGLTSTVLRYCSSFSPKNHRKVSTKRQIMFLANKYKRIIQSIDKFGGIDALERELNDYESDDDLNDLEDLKYSDYWDKVKQLKENGWVKYKILPRFALAMSTIFNSNSECERMFSKQTRLSRNPDRNRMSQKMFESHLTISSGVEGKESTHECEKCNNNEAMSEVGIETQTYHCHCSVAPIPEAMKSLCRSSRLKNRNILEEKAARSDLEKSLAISRKRKFDETVEKEIEVLKNKIGTRATLLPPNKMLRVWEPKKKPASSKTSTVSKKSTTAKKSNTSNKPNAKK